MVAISSRFVFVVDLRVDDRTSSRGPNAPATSSPVRYSHFQLDGRSANSGLVTQESVQAGEIDRPLRVSSRQPVGRETCGFVRRKIDLESYPTTDTRHIAVDALDVRNRPTIESTALTDESVSYVRPRRVLVPTQEEITRLRGGQTVAGTSVLSAVGRTLTSDLDERRCTPRVRR